MTIPSLPWYPSFNTVTAAFAPETENVPTPFSQLVSTKASVVLPQNLLDRLTQKIGSAASGTEARGALMTFATDFSGRLTLSLSSMVVQKVMGSGPVPAYAPKSGVLAAPVVNGSCSGGTFGTAIGFDIRH